jgi:hypothetical protein
LVAEKNLEREWKEVKFGWFKLNFLH